MTYSREVLKVREKAVVEGKCTMGTFNEVLRNVNLLEIDKPLGMKLPRFLNNFRLKEWEAFQIADENWFICIAVSNIKIFGMAFVFLFNKKTQKTHFYSSRSVPSRFDVPSGLINSRCSHKSGNLEIEILNNLENDSVEITFNAGASGGSPDCRGRYTAKHTTEPLVILQPFAENRPLYSHKALMPGSGMLEMGAEVYESGPEDCGIIIDDHKGFYPYKLRYDWVTAIGYSEGRLAGFNLTDNQILEPERYNENCLWLEGRMIPLPPVKVERPDGVEGPWLIRDRYGRIDLRFTPLEGKLINLNLGIISLFYYGPVGIYEGRILDDEDVSVPFDGWIGMGEKRSDRM